MEVETLNCGGLVRLCTTTTTFSVLSTTLAMPAAAMLALVAACASASAYNQICELVEQIHRWWICTDPPTLLFFLVKFNRFNFLLKYIKRKERFDMSVPAGERNLSSAQFVYDAFNLYKLALRICLSMPKRYTYMIAHPLLEKARRLNNLCIHGNSIFPIKYKEDFAMRRQFLLQAKGVACSISADISALLYIKYEVDNGENSPLVSVRDSDLNTWSSLLNKEIKTLEKIIRSDEKSCKKNYYKRKKKT